MVHGNGGKGASSLEGAEGPGESPQRSRPRGRRGHGAGTAPTPVLTLGLGRVQSPSRSHIGPHRPPPGEPRTKAPEPPATAWAVRPLPSQRGEDSDQRREEWNSQRGACPVSWSCCHSGETTLVTAVGGDAVTRWWWWGVAAAAGHRYVWSLWSAGVAGRLSWATCSHSFFTVT